jgi:very-short-patch-repair endonuclease
MPDYLANALTRISESSRDQDGVFRRGQLAEWRVGDAELRALARRGCLRRLRHGIYVTGDLWGKALLDPPLQHRIELRAAIISLGLPAYAFAESAALLHGLPLPFRAPRVLNLVRDLRRDSRSLKRPSAHPITLPGAAVTSHGLTVRDTTEADGIPSVSLALAAISCSASLSGDWPTVVLDAALWRSPDLGPTLHEVLEDWPQLRGRATVVEALRAARSGAQTALETVSRVRLMRRGLPEPLLQHRFDDAAGLIGYADMFWPNLRVIGEADGQLKYESQEVLWAEKQREDRLRAKGFAVVRWGWAEITETPDQVAQRIRAAAGWAR